MCHILHILYIFLIHIKMLLLKKCIFGGHSQQQINCTHVTLKTNFGHLHACLLHKQQQVWHSAPYYIYVKFMSI